MKKYKKIIIVALCIALLMSMFTVSAFAVDTPEGGVVSHGGVFYVDSGWTIPEDSGFVRFDGFYGTVVAYGIAGYSFDFDSVYFGFNAINEVSADTIYFYNQSTQIGVAMTPSSDFVFTISVDLPVVPFSPLNDFLNNYVEFVPYGPEYSVTFDISENWTCPAGFFNTSGDFSVGDNSYTSLALGSDGDEAVANSVHFSSMFRDVSFLFADSFSFTAYEYFPEDYLNLFYFGFHNGEVNTFIVPPTILESMFGTFSSVGQWISGAASSLVSMFWDGSSLTFVGILSVSALALGVVFLILSFIERFLRFGG